MTSKNSFGRTLPGCNLIFPFVRRKTSQSAKSLISCKISCFSAPCSKLYEKKEIRNRGDGRHRFPHFESFHRTHPAPTPLLTIPLSTSTVLWHFTSTHRYSILRPDKKLQSTNSGPQYGLQES
ncbi:hypothetical protein TNIN_352271 [Trichonephila inaurata madagascariensis]|uniref:Uncharacterized protein n=1 Tax=Trichonephila inaurata madagascariensis TaxID=2747483 RepID=A0A8X6XKZ6_9ARAC|nr:hypothetical protein TNIN_352271 [Trichonephila inaurata madagascariensis]